MSQEMSKKLFQSIGYVPNAQGSWKLIRDAVVYNMIGKDVFPMPHIQDGSHYKLGDVVLKEPRKISHRILGTPPKAIRAGHLNRFIKPRKTEGDNDAIASFGCEFTESKYVFFKEKTKKGTKKSILVEVEGCEEVSMTNIPEENSLSVSILGQPKFYLVSTVYCVQKVQITVQINDKMDKYMTSSPDWTIGFKLHRYNADDDGNIGAPARKFPKKLNIDIVSRKYFPGLPTVDPVQRKREKPQSQNQESPPVYQNARYQARRHTM